MSEFGSFSTERHTYFMLPQFRGWKLFTPAVIVLLILHTLGYVVLAVTWGPECAPSELCSNIMRAIGLTPIPLITHLGVWQIVTYDLLHPGLIHLIYMLLLFLFFGSGLEREWGTKRFVIFYLVAVVVLGLIRMLPNVSSGGPLVGGLGSWCAILTAFGLVFRHERIWLLFVTVRVPYFVMGILFITILVCLRPAWNLLWCLGIPLGYYYPKFFWRRERRGRHRPVPEADNRFAELDVGD